MPSDISLIFTQNTASTIVDESMEGTDNASNLNTTSFISRATTFKPMRALVTESFSFATKPPKNPNGKKRRSSSKNESSTEALSRPVSQYFDQNRNELQSLADLNIENTPRQPQKGKKNLSSQSKSTNQSAS